MSRRRARTRGPAEVVEATALAGAAFGLLHAAAGAKAHHTGACRRRENSGACIGHALHPALGSYLLASDPDRICRGNTGLAFEFGDHAGVVTSERGDAAPDLTSHIRKAPAFPKQQRDEAAA